MNALQFITNLQLQFINEIFKYILHFALIYMPHVSAAYVKPAWQLHS